MAHPLGCSIRGQPTCELGKAPNVTVALTNQTAEEVYLIGSLDASDSKWRYPHCYFEVTGPDGTSAVQGIGRCGNMNTLREQDFVEVPPGGAFDPLLQQVPKAEVRSNEIKATFVEPGK